MAVDYSWASSWVLLNYCISLIYFGQICNIESLWVVVVVAWSSYVLIIDIPVAISHIWLSNGMQDNIVSAVLLFNNGTVIVIDSA